MTVAITKPVPRVTTRPLPASMKVFKPGRLHTDIRVPCARPHFTPLPGNLMSRFTIPPVSMPMLSTPSRSIAVAAHPRGVA